MSIFESGTLQVFFDRWKCTKEERNLLVIYLAVIRLKEQMDKLRNWIECREMTDGEGI